MASQFADPLPGWAIHDGVVYFRGAIKLPTAGANSFARLPKAARPVHNLYVQVFTRLDFPGTLYVGADGTLAAFHGNAAAFTSLAAVSYPTSAIKPRKLTLTPGWTSSQAAYDTGDPSYAISRGVVSMAEAKHTSPLWTHLPAQVRAAAHLLLIETYTDGGTAGVIELHNGLGDVSSNPFANARGYASFAAIAYPQTS